MNAWMSTLRALPMTFTLFVLQAWVATLATLPIASEVTRSLPGGKAAVALAASLEQLLALGATLRPAGQSWLLLGLSWLVLSPWLQMAWLSNLAHQSSVGAALVAGTRLYVRACFVSLWVLLGATLVTAPLALSACGVWHFMADHPSDRLRDLLTLGLILPALPLLGLAHTWHDLARARALYESAFKAALHSARFALKPTLFLSAFLLAGVGWALVAVSQLVVDDHHIATQPSFVLVALLQSCLLARLVLRSRWLAQALACAEAATESRAF